VLKRREATNTVTKVGMQLIKEKKRAVLQQVESMGAVEKGHVEGKDLLSTLSK
jgi:ribosomal protein S19E (S16A)